MLSYSVYFEIKHQKWSTCVYLLSTCVCKIWLKKCRWLYKFWQNSIGVILRHPVYSLFNECYRATTDVYTAQLLGGPNALWPTQPKFWVGHGPPRRAPLPWKPTQNLMSKIWN